MARKLSSPAQGRGGSFISDSGSKPNFMTDVKAKNIESSNFDLSRDVKTTFDMGFLIPCFVQETLPNGKYTVASELFARFQALASPAMHRFDITVESFYVPYRTLWDGWEKSLMSVHNGNTTPPAIPYFNNLVVSVGSEADYLGLPLKTIDKVNPFAFAASNFIWNEYYRNPAIDAEIPYKLIDGLNPQTGFNVLKKKRWGSDYFTRALPAPQAGQPVTLPVGALNDVPVYAAQAPVVGGAWKTADGSSDYNNARNIQGMFTNPLNTNTGTSVNGTSGKPNYYDPQGSLYADTSALSLTSVSIGDLRLAMRLQEWAERAMRFVGGSKGRYKDFMKGFFGANIPDGTLQRPVYLGGFSQPMVINGVTQTSETSSTPLGDLAGQGVSIGNGKAFSYETDEHGLILSFMCCRPKTSYLDGLPKMYSKFDPIDFGHPDFVHLSEQGVLNKEIYYDASDGQNNNYFGYQPIYSDYRFANSTVHGKFRTDQSYWTEARKFAARPVLNSSFIECTPSQRVFALQPMPASSQIQCQIFWHVNARLPLPYFGTPMT